MVPSLGHRHKADRPPAIPCFATPLQRPGLELEVTIDASRAGPVAAYVAPSLGP